MLGQKLTKITLALNFYFLNSALKASHKAP